MIQVPKLASAAEYFFKMGVEGKRFRPTVRIKESQCRFSKFHSIDVFFFLISKMNNILTKRAIHSIDVRLATFMH